MKNCRFRLNASALRLKALCLFIPIRYGAGMEIFADKTVFVIGAATDLMWRLLPLMEAGPARVVLLDCEDDEIMSMARRAPSIVEPICLESLSPLPIKLVGDIWATEPIDILLDLTALSEEVFTDQRAEISRSVLAAFEPALMAADGCVVSVIPQAGESADIDSQMSEAASLRLAEVTSKKWARWRVTLNVLRPEAGASASDMAKAIEIAIRAGWDNFTGVHIPIQSDVH